MIIKKKQENNKMVIELDGRLDTNTAPKLEEEISNMIDNIENLQINMENLQYIASAGLRVLLSLHKKITKKGTMVIVGANETIMEVFKVTGFSDILTIK